MVYLFISTTSSADNDVTTATTVMPLFELRLAPTMTMTTTATTTNKSVLDDSTTVMLVLDDICETENVDSYDYPEKLFFCDTFCYTDCFLVRLFL